MMERTTQGDLLFLLAAVSLFLTTVLLFILWVVALLVRRMPNVRMALGRATLVLAILCCLTIVAGWIYYHWFGYGAMKKARAEWIETRAKLKDIEAALALYMTECNALPTAEKGLSALHEDPGVKGWDGPYIKNRDLFVDSWNTPIRYRLGKAGFVLRSAGRDRQFNTHDDVTLGTE